MFIGTITLFNEEKSIPFLLPVIGIGHLLIYFCVKGIRFEPKKSYGSIFTHEKHD
jgi:YQGE family putative transporter